MKRAWLLPLVLELAAAGCARGAPPNYSGTVGPRRAEPEALLELAAPSDGYEALGSASVACTLRPGFRALDSEPLSDFDCSFQRLGWLLREAAAAAGGDALVAERCTQNARSTQRRLACTAGVARHRAVGAELSPLRAPRSLAPSRPAPSPRDVERIDEPDALLATRIRLDFTPSIADFAAEPQSASNVRELAFEPVWAVPLGALRAHCEASCSERALRHALLVAAGRLGAADVVAVSCASLSGETQCIGRLTAPDSER